MSPVQHLPYLQGKHAAFEKLGMGALDKLIITNPRLASLLPFLAVGGTGAALGAARSDEEHRGAGALRGAGLGLLLGALGGAAGGAGGLLGGQALAKTPAMIRAAKGNLQRQAWNELGLTMAGGATGLALGAGAGAIGGGLLGRVKEKTWRERLGL